MNTCGWIDGVGYELILHAINAFQAGTSPSSVNDCVACSQVPQDLILCMDNERLYNDLAQYYAANRNIKVTKLAKSGGVRSSYTPHTGTTTTPTHDTCTHFLPQRRRW